MKLRNIMILILSSIMLLAFSACNEEKIKDTSFVGLKDTAITLNVNDNCTLEMSANSITADLFWQSDNLNIATVSENGLVTAISEGTAIITVSSNDGLKSAKCTITVDSAPIFTLEQKTLSLYIKDEYTLKYTTNKTTDISWSSSDASIASVSDEGVVKAIAKGTTVITVTQGDIEEKCNVTVEEHSITFEKTSAYLVEGKTLEIKATSTLTDNKIWSSDNEAIATVSQDGIVTAVSIGTAVIKATIGDIYCECTINVIDNITISVNDNIDLIKGERYNLTANVSFGDVIWSSDNEAIATVSQDGIVTAISAGTAKIKLVSILDETAFAECEVNITDPYPEYTAVATATEFKAMSLNGKYYLVNDIDFTDIAITGIQEFAGTLDGRGYSLKNITININENHQALFQTLHSTSKLINLNVINAKITNKQEAVYGGLFGKNFGLIENCKFEVEINSLYSEKTAVIGQNIGKIQNVIALVTFNSDLSASAEANPKVLVAQNLNAATVINSYAYISDSAIGKVNFIASEGGTVTNSNLMTDEQFKTASNFNNYDEEIWFIGNGVYPILRYSGFIEPLTVRMDEDNISLDIDNEITLGYNITPSSEENAEVVWSSSDENIVTVDANGKIKGIAAGTAIIRVYLKIDDTRYYECTVLVINSSVEITVDLSDEILALYENATKTITATTSQGDVTWTSSDINIATVDSNGLITAISTGVTYIRATSVIDSTIYKECQVTVNTDYSIYTAITTAAEFQAMSIAADAKYYLANDIDFTDITISGNQEFNGILDGRGYSLNNISLTITANHQGFFKILHPNSKIKNINFNATISNNGGNYGGLIAFSYGTIKNCVFNVEIDAAGSNMTGIIGQCISGTIENVLSNTIITGTLSTNGAANPKAFVAQYINGTIINCFNLCNESNVIFVSNDAGIAEYTGVNMTNSSFKTESELQTASLYSDWSTLIWNIIDGSIPTLKIM